MAKKAKALAFCNGSVVTAKALRSEGWSLSWIADKLNESRATARRGGKFRATLVRRLLIMAGYPLE